MATDDKLVDIRTDIDSIDQQLTRLMEHQDGGSMKTRRKSRKKRGRKSNRKKLNRKKLNRKTRRKVIKF